MTRILKAIVRFFTKKDIHGEDENGPYEESQDGLYRIYHEKRGGGGREGPDTRLLPGSGRQV